MLVIILAFFGKDLCFDDINFTSENFLLVFPGRPFFLEIALNILMLKQFRIMKIFTQKFLFFGNCFELVRNFLQILC